MSSNKKIKAGSRPSLVKNLLFVEGFSRGGKLVLGNVVNGFEGVEPIQYYGLLEHIPFLEKFGLMDKTTAQELLKCEIDTHCYEMLIGRNFNYRVSDGTSIYKVPGWKIYLKRSREEDRDKELAKFNKQENYSFFMMHELMPNIKIYFETFPKLKVVSIKRNPVDIAYSWSKRGLLSRFGKDPKIFMVPIKGKNGPVPWYAYPFRDKYHDLSEVEKVILSVKNLFEMYKESYSKLPKKFKKQILFVPFEDYVFNNTDKVIKNIGKFLGKKPLPELKAILKREDVPRKGGHTDACSSKEEKFMCTECKLDELKKLASAKYINILTKLKNDYESGKTY